MDKGDAMSQPMIILAVDDSMVMLKILSGAIAALGYEPITAPNGKEALDVLERRVDDVAVVILDWNMPVLGGLDTLRLIRADERLKHLPVLMVTTESERKNLIQAMQAGANHYLTKPFSQEDLATHLAQCLGVSAFSSKEQDR